MLYNRVALDAISLFATLTIVPQIGTRTGWRLALRGCRDITQSNTDSSREFSVVKRSRCPKPRHRCLDTAFDLNLV